MKKVNIYFFLAILSFWSCTEWQDLSKDQLLKNEVCKKLLVGNETVAEIKCNLDRSIIEFTIINFDKQKLNDFDKIADEEFWCSVAKFENERLYAFPSTESFENAEVVSIYFDPDAKIANILIQ